MTLVWAKGSVLVVDPVGGRFSLAPYGFLLSLKLVAITQTGQFDCR